MWQQTAQKNASAPDPGVGKVGQAWLGWVGASSWPVLRRPRESSRNDVMLRAGQKRGAAQTAGSPGPQPLSPQAGSRGRAAPPRLQLGSCCSRPHPGCEMSEGRLSFPGLEAKFTSLAGRRSPALLTQAFPTPTEGPGATFPKPARPTPTIPAPGMAHTWVDPGSGPGGLGTSQPNHPRAERGCPFQPGKAQVGRGGGRGRSLRGFQPGNKTERTNPASKYVRVTQGWRGSGARRSAPLEEGLPHRVRGPRKPGGRMRWVPGLAPLDFHFTSGLNLQNPCPACVPAGLGPRRPQQRARQEDRTEAGGQDRKGLPGQCVAAKGRAGGGIPATRPSPPLARWTGSPRS